MKQAAIYARVSTVDRGQDPETQLRQLREYAGRRSFSIALEYVDRASGSKNDRPEYRAMLEAARRREFDVLLVWRYDRFARSMRELVNALSEFESLGIDFISYNEGADTTTPQGKLIFGIMASLAEFERSLIAERVKAGMQRAKAQGKQMGRPRVPEAKRRAILDLLGEGKLSRRAIGREVGVSHELVRLIEKERGREPSDRAQVREDTAWPEPAQVPRYLAEALEKGSPPMKAAALTLWLVVENNSKFVRGKTRARRDIEGFLLRYYDMKKLRDCEYELTIRYEDDEALENEVNELLAEMANLADLRHCFIETDLQEKGTDRAW